MTESAPTTHELARRMDALEATTKLDRAELRADISAGFASLNQRLDDLSLVSPQVFEESQKRQDAEVSALNGEIVWLRRVIVFGFLSAMAIFAIQQGLAA